MKNKYISLIGLLTLFIVIILINFCLFPISVLAKGEHNQNKNKEVVEKIQEANNQLKNDIKYEKYCRIACAAFPFYRATNYLFWDDFSKDNRFSKFSSEQTNIWISGDLHVDNFGAYHNDENEVIFDLNDFDESVISNYQYDVWRMATSIILSISNSHTTTLNLDEKNQIADVIDKFTESYLDTLAEYQGNNDETKTYFTNKNTEGEIKELIEYAEKKSRNKLLEKWTIDEKDRKRFKTPKERDILGIASLEEKEAITSQMKAYGNTLTGKLEYNENYFKVKDIAPRLKAGLGSLGTPRYYILLEGESDSLEDDRILDIKRQSKPTPYHVFNSTEKATYDKFFDNDAQRHAIAYRALTKHTDDFLGWMYLSDKNGEFSGYYSVREMSPNKASLDDLEDKEGNAFTFANAKQSDLLEIAKLWGKILATDHARADKDFEEKYIPYSFEKEVTQLTNGKHKEFRELVKEVAFDYANQVESDYDSFLQFITKLKLEKQLINCPNCD
ncbi:DUF2252 domain-containing protein [Crocosphaera chwakensis]|uniref:DUF2252 domain-containing protein n=1 Tax=Crocosphaera chwakensis CCY0110 TaxID=391612 RepID=A3IMJ3_9CHRO|nr:DUF2252 family protein [Crocosphaera chwakensis]EAZ92362.1 hypothetical protein CY0110_28424 [Crocosphaera chwakensis CCY0110]